MKVRPKLKPRQTFFLDSDFHNNREFAIATILVVGDIAYILWLAYTKNRFWNFDEKEKNPKQLFVWKIIPNEKIVEKLSQTYI